MPVEINGKLYSWNQPICDACWRLREPNREPVRFRHPVEMTAAEQCAFCGQEHRSGIYLRADPRKVPFPREEEPDE